MRRQGKDPLAQRDIRLERIIGLAPRLLHLMFAIEYLARKGIEVRPRAKVALDSPPSVAKSDSNAASASRASVRTSRISASSIEAPNLSAHSWASSK